MSEIRHSLSRDDSFSDAVADEIHEFNEDVINEAVMEDDFIGSQSMSRAITHESRLSNQIDDEQNVGNLERRPSAINRRKSTIVSNIKNSNTYKNITKFSWWDTEFKRDRIKIYITFLQNYILLSIILIVVLGLYWGSYYGREKRYVNFKFLVVNSDVDASKIDPVIGSSILATANSSTVEHYGTWTVKTYSELEALTSENQSVFDYVRERIHHQEYWGAIYVRPNVTSSLYDAITNNNTDFNITENLVDVIYETGRDYITMSQYVTSFLKVFETAFIKVLGQQLPTFVKQLPDENKIDAISFLTQPFTFKYNDLVPVAGAILLAPLQLGLTFLVIFAFFQMIMTIKIQIYLSTVVTGVQYILIRTLISQVSYIIISLGYVIVNVAFGIDHTATFGKSGGLVLWAFGYLTMASLGTLNEVVAMICFKYYPPLIGGWLVFLMASNIAPTVSSMALTNHFYRYGYAMPIHNSYEAVKVVFSDIYKGNLGRHLGILIAWIVIGNIASPFLMVQIAKAKAKEAAEAKLKEESDEKTSNEDSTI